jgi:Putative beta-barrel porin-2, OmpL-like. bbp2
MSEHSSSKFKTIPGESEQRMKNSFPVAALVALSLVMLFAPHFGVLAVAQTAGQNAAQPAEENAAPPAPAPAANQNSADLSKKVQDLEQEIEELRAEMAAMKGDGQKPPSVAVVASTGVPPLTAAALAVPAVPFAAQAAAAPPAPEKITLAGLLGPTTLSGFVDVYYDYNSNQPSSRTTALRNFDINSSQFGLNMLELVADKGPDASASRLGYHIALGFGEAMNQVNSGSESSFDQYLKEGYLEYLAPVGKGLQINVGKFVTPAGAEVIESKDNWNYSRGILFSWAIPYFHFGVNAKYAFNSKFSLTGYLVNGWNNSVDNNSGKTGGFSAAWTPNAKFSIVQNYLGGPEQSNDNSDFRHLLDTVVTYSPNAKLSFIANYDYGHDRVEIDPGPPRVTSPVWWSGFAGYIKYAPKDKWYIATRGEWFKDHDGFETGTPQTLGSFTITGQRLIAGKLISRLEYRRDMSDQNFFPYRDGQFGNRDSQNTVTLGLIYAFSSADAK